MSNAVQRLFSQFSEGLIDFASLQRELDTALRADPSLRQVARDAVQELYQAGRLPPQLYQALLAHFEPQVGHITETPEPVDDSTNIPIPDTEDQRTRLKAISDAQPAPERTRLKPSMFVADEPFASISDNASLPKASVQTGSSAGTGTGSNWANPEEWSENQGGVLMPGDSISRYYIESVLGEGGMGVVFKARDRLKEEARDPDPYVAIKVLSEDFRQHPQSFIALAREWKKAASLSHENIITVHNFDRVGTTVFMTMELLNGEPLDKLLKAHHLRGLPKERASKITEGCARALAFAHSKGVVHSDFKPGNVFVTENDEIKVLDFGIARAVPTAIRATTDETVFDAAELGAMTPTYASAQMLAGKVPVPADDVYALAIVAYELFTGRHPYDRTPADVARKNGLIAPTLVGPSRRQRRAIMRGLALDDSRQMDAGVFYRQWRGLGLPKWVYGAIGALLIAAIFFAYRSFLDPGPDVPFGELSAADQSKFQIAIEKGNESLEFAAEVDAGEYKNALTFFDKAYQIHPRNPLAEERLEQTADGWLASLSTVNVNPAAKAGILDTSAAMFCNAHLHTYKPVIKDCVARFGSSKCVWTDSNCVESLKGN